ncbi:hypothetical protein LA374_03560 [Aeromonas schubertii]|uniref:Uncharacterized protein n=1 Tax=Aeromonas schubertii TaxID=652 RepID=A0ABS7V7D1_9GAMM|nr:hypothetical protein [Aeromonas schubertii]MBZ6065290.1 hypothetical protein [Aeromonas schubertii]
MNKEAPLLPLEYCRIDRAARLLNCEIDDIVHWCSLGVIQGVFWIYDSLCTPVFFKGDEIIEDDSEYNRLLDSFFCLNDVEPNENKTVLLGPHSTLNISIPSVKRGSTPIISAEGFWSVDKKIFEYFALHRDTYLEEWALSPIGVGQGDHSMSIFLFESEHDNIITPSSAWIFKHDLDLLKEHIKSGEPFPIGGYRQAKRPHKKITLPHPVAERHAANRERVLAAAIHAKLNPVWRDEPDDTATSWAEKIINHEHALFDDNVCPLSSETVNRLLSSAIKTGKPYKGK